MFKNINHLRYFVQSIIQHSGVSVALQESIDIAVYYEKKSLRTFLSTKKSLTSSSNPLLSTERFEASSRTDLEIFQNSLICVVDDQPSDGLCEYIIAMFQADKVFLLNIYTHIRMRKVNALVSQAQDP